MPSPWSERLVFGMVVPCPRCHLTGKQPAPAMTKADAAERRRQNLRREAEGLDPLPKPPRTVPCERCGGKGHLPAAQELAGDDEPEGWEP